MPKDYLKGGGLQSSTKSQELEHGQISGVHGKKVFLVGSDGEQINQFLTEKYDYVVVTYPVATTDVYTFKEGGSGGTTVATVTLVYTDSTKSDLSTVTKA